jgi:hypothetical protein
MDLWLKVVALMEQVLVDQIGLLNVKHNVKVKFIKKELYLWLMPE